MNEESGKVKKYFNKAQLQAMTIAAKDSTYICSRALGKSEGFDATSLVRDVHAMPRSAGALLSPTYGKLLRNTLPAVCSALERLGYYRNIHYVIGKKPPKHLNYNTPYIEPFDYEYVMSWYNGSIAHLISFDRPMSANSMSLDWVKGFEAKFLDYKKITEEVGPANRGNIQYFGNCPWHHGTLWTSDMPTNKMGMWLLEEEKKIDKDLIELISLTYKEYAYAKVKSEKYPSYKQKVKSLKAELNKYRKNAIHYGEYDIFWNIEVVGEDFVKQMKRDLPPLIFRTSILNERMRKLEGGFYSGLDEKTHYYSSYDYQYIDNLEPINEKNKTECRWDGDIDSSLPMCIANDSNSAINSICNGQRIGREARCERSNYVKTPRKLQEAVEDWCSYYKHLKNRDIVYYYDSTMIQKSAVTSETFADIVIKTLRKAGFNVFGVYIGNPMKHNLKHEYIDKAFKGDPAYLFPTFNQDNNEYLLLAMEQTGIKQGRNGFEKDKSAEKDPDTPENPDEKKTHITDAWDTLYIGMNFYPIDTISQIGSAYQWNQSG
jgi:hypothetical protein